jgi:hypothetical protein
VTPRDRRRVLAALGGAVAVAGLVALGGLAAGGWPKGLGLRPLVDDPPPEEPAVVAAAAAPAPAPAVDTSQPSPALPDEPEVPLPVGRARLATSLGRRTADEYRRQARYPRSSQPLDDAADDPIARDREVSAITARGPNGEEPTLHVFPARPNFESPEAVVLFAKLTVRNRPTRAREIRATVLGESMTPLGEIDYRDDGTNGDASPGDGLYTAVVQVPREAAPRLSQSYLVQVRAALTNGQERLAATSFLYSNPHARLTGRYADAALDGNLVLDAEVDVFEAGRFHLEATLYSGDGAHKLLWSQTAVALEPGTQWMRLVFYGLGLREKGLDGPYLVRYAALSTTTEMPNAKNHVAENVHLTAAHRAAAFSDRPFDDPALLEAADRAEQDALPGGLEAGS